MIDLGTAAHEIRQCVSGIRILSRLPIAVAEVRFRGSFLPVSVASNGF